MSLDLISASDWGVVAVWLEADRFIVKDPQVHSWDEEKVKQWEKEAATRWKMGQ